MSEIVVFTPVTSVPQSSLINESAKQNVHNKITKFF